MHLGVILTLICISSAEVKLKMYTRTQRIWRRTDCVCFDVDSTVTQEEAIDELAKFCGKGPEVANLTKQAMGGTMTFQEALAIRLDIIQPSTNQIKEFIRTNLPTLTPGVKKLIETLHSSKIPVYLVSGGFRSLILPIGSQLNIPPDMVYANRIKFYFSGEYAGFDDTQPTSRSGGKAEVVRILKEKHRYANLVMVGDGMTDFEACPPADAFIGYGGNIVRDQVRTKSEWYVTDFNELVNIYKQ